MQVAAKSAKIALLLTGVPLCSCNGIDREYGGANATAQ
jgi:hypothetical protein